MMMESKLSNKVVKLEDFQKNPNLLNATVDLICIIAKIGELKNVTEDNAENLPLRDLVIYDDTYTMVRLILRGLLAEKVDHLKVDDIIYLENVKIWKAGNRFVMTTSIDTKIDLHTTTREAQWLRHWHLENRKEIVKNNFAQLKNLSMSPAQPKKEREKHVTSSTPSESSPAKMTRQAPEIKTALPKMNESPRVDSSMLSPMSPSSPINPTPDLINNKSLSPPPQSQKSNNSFLLSPLSPLNSKSDSIINRRLSPPRSQKNIPDQSTEISNGSNNKENQIHVVRETDDKDKVKKVEHLSQKVENEAKKSVDDIKADVRFETYNTLMHSPCLGNDWDEDKDKYLVNFITKNTFNLQNDTMYNKLLIEYPDVFVYTTTTMLKERVFMLSKVQNYLYLLKLCGGDLLTTEKEKSIFMAKVEKLRESMKLIK